MPIDTFKVPSEAIDLETFIPAKEKSDKAPRSLPHIFFTVGTNPSTEGSAYLEYNDIEIYCGVRGPLEMKQDGQLVTSVKFARFMRWSDYGRKTQFEKRLSHLLLSAIESSIMLHCFPRGKYEIEAIVLDNGGKVLDSPNLEDCLSGCITCTAIALLDANVQLYDIPIGLSMDFPFGDDGQSGGSLCVAVLPKLRQFSMLHSTDASIPSSLALRNLLEQSLQWGRQLSDTIKARFGEFYQE